MMALSDKLNELEAIVGASHVLTATETVSSYRVEGQQPLAVVSPGSQEELAAILKAATESRFTLLLRGAGRHLHLGAPPGPIGLLLSTARLHRVIEHDAENLTVTVEAGITLGQLQQLVAAQGQFLPLDPPGSDQATVGGIASTNLAGPLRMSYGSPRDLIIGLRVALADGTLLKTGGKTVKNVAGYELGKLFLGSFGSLGAICELTIKLSPTPASRAIMAAVVSPEKSYELGVQALSSRLEIATLDLCNYEAARKMKLSLPVTPRPQMFVMFAGLIGDREAIARQERELRAIFGPDCGRIDNEEMSAVWENLREAPYPRMPSEVIAKINVPPAAAYDLATQIERLEQWWLVQRAGDGVIYIGPPEQMPEEQIEIAFSVLRQQAKEAGGYLMLESASPIMKQSFKVWGQIPNTDLMQYLKDSYDPSGTLGCGRLV